MPFERGFRPRCATRGSTIVTVIARYSRPAMKRIWSDESRFARWLEVELAALDGWAEVGAVPQEAAEAIRQRAVPPLPERVAGIDLMVQTGLGDVVLPEVGAMRMAIDEHHQHKDVYWHSLTVLRQAIDLESDGPDLVLRWAALLHEATQQIPNPPWFE